MFLFLSLYTEEIVKEPEGSSSKKIKLNYDRSSIVPIHLNIWRGSGVKIYLNAWPTDGKL